MRLFWKEPKKQIRMDHTQNGQYHTNGGVIGKIVDPIILTISIRVGIGFIVVGGS